MVFSAQWFEQYQGALLRFANTRYGRYVLRIHGERSGVGKQRIVRIEPHAITWCNADGSYSTEYRTHAKYAKRLYYTFKLVWWLFHAWDMAVANNLNAALNLGFDSLTSFPEVGEGVTTADGTVWRTAVSNSFTTMRSSFGTGSEVFESQIYAYLVSGAGTNDFASLGRASLAFDTSTIPATATIVSGSISLYSVDKQAAIGQPDVHITASDPSQRNRLTASDYQRFSGTSFANIAYGSITPGYNAFTLDASGRGNIVKAGVSAFGARTSWDTLGSFTGAWVANSVSSHTFSASDATGSSSDPFLTVTYTKLFSSSPHGSLRLSGGIAPKATYHISLGGTLTFSDTMQVSKVAAPVAGKEFVYRIYDADDNYIGVWSDVITDLNWQQRLNTPGATTTVRLARSANTRSERREALVDQTGDPLTDESGDPFSVTFETINTVGEGTDVENNLNVDVYAHYGGFEDLVTEDGQNLVTETDEQFIVAVGAPLGVRVFSGFILTYSAHYGQQDYIDVLLSSHGFELTHEVIKSGSNTTVTFSAQAHDTIIKSILDTNPGRVGYSADSIEGTATNITQKFRLNTKLEGIEAVYNQTDDGWHWYGSVRDPVVYFRNQAAAADHTFVFGRHIKEITLERSMEELRNVVYFVGGDTGGGVILYKKYTDAVSLAAWRQGLYRITDRRFTDATAAQRYATKVMANNAEPIYTTTVQIPSEVYDIETIALGQMVGFANFDNFVDSLLLQIVSISYTPTLVSLDLGGLLQRQTELIQDVTDDLQTEQYETIPNAPS